MQRSAFHLTAHNWKVTAVTSLPVPPAYQITVCVDRWWGVENASGWMWDSEGQAQVMADVRRWLSKHAMTTRFSVCSSLEWNPQNWHIETLEWDFLGMNTTAVVSLVPQWLRWIPDYEAHLSGVGVEVLASLANRSAFHVGCTTRGSNSWTGQLADAAMKYEDRRCKWIGCDLHEN